MPKISALEAFEDVSGSEQVVMVKDGRTGRGAIGPVVEQIAQPLVNQAAASADLANAAAQAAMISAHLYASAAAGLAATAVGDYFFAAGAGATFLILYRHDAGPVATEIARALSSAFIATAAGAGAVGILGGGSVQDKLDELTEAALERVRLLDFGDVLAQAFENLSAGDAGDFRRRLAAAPVEALKSCALNFNGNCRISQQYGATEVTNIGENDADGQQLWIIDGHKLWVKGTCRVKAAQVAVTDLPGFSHAMRVEVTVAEAAMIAGDFVRHVTTCETGRFLPMAWGTPKARDMVRYAWVKTSMAGTYQVAILNGDRTAAAQLGHFTVDAPNKWQLVRTIIPGQVAASAWDVGGMGYKAEIALAGDTSPNLAAEAGHYFMWTGELYLPADYDPGLPDTAPLMPSLQENLALCQRYYQKSYNMSTVPGSAAQFAGGLSHIAEASVSYMTVANVRFGVPMATIPTITVFSVNSGASGKAYNSNTAADIDLTTQSAGAMGFHAFTNGVAVTAGHGLSFHYTADARLG